MRGHFQLHVAPRFPLTGQNSVPGLHLAAREVGKRDLDSGQPGAQLQVGVLRKQGETHGGNTVSAPPANWKEELMLKVRNDPWAGSLALPADTVIAQHPAAGSPRVAGHADISIHELA